MNANFPFHWNQSHVYRQRARTGLSSTRLQQKSLQGWQPSLDPVVPLKAGLGRTFRGFLLVQTAPQRPVSKQTQSSKLQDLTGSFIFLASTLCEKMTASPLFYNSNESLKLMKTNLYPTPCPVCFKRVIGWFPQCSSWQQPIKESHRWKSGM